MKTVITFSLMAILATAVIMPGLTDAFALQANNSEKLTPKAYGAKTAIKMAATESKVHKIVNEIQIVPAQSYDSVKKIKSLIAKPIVKADTNDDKTPKAYGAKTIGKLKDDGIKTHTGGFEGLKQEQVKNFKKQMSDMNAKEILKQLYRRG